MYHTLLVPLDGSTLSERALPFAYAIAQRSGAVLHLVHVTTPCQVIYIAGLPVIDEQLHSRRREHELAYLEHACATLPSDPAVIVRSDLLDGPVVPALVDVIAMRHVDLVVLTSHGAGGFERAWLGSVADQLIRQSAAPVLVVPGSAAQPDAAEVTLDRVLIPLDGSARARAILPFALSIGGHAATYTLVSVVTPFDAATPGSRVDVEQRRAIDAEHAAIAQRLTAEGYRVQTRVQQHAHPAAALLAEARTGQHTLVALATHGRSGLPRHVLGSVADKLLRAAELPVLVYRPVTDDERAAR